MLNSKIVLLLAGAALALSACDNGPSAVAPKQAAGTQMAEDATPGTQTSTSDASDGDRPARTTATIR